MTDRKFREWDEDIARFWKLREKDEQFIRLIKMVAPGTQLRTGIEYIVQAQIGGMIVLGVSRKRGIMEAGFVHNKEFSPNALYEISKMDGAVIITKNADKILYSNVHLHPTTKIHSLETGTRHRVAERFARETGQSVIAISKKRNVVTVFSGSIKYSLKYIPELLSEVAQAINTYEQYTRTIQDYYYNITISEIKGTTTLGDVVHGIIRYMTLKKILRVIERKITELGGAGKILKMRLDDLSTDIKEGAYLIKDYIVNENLHREEEIFTLLDMFSEFSYLEPLNILSVLGDPKNLTALDARVEPRGFRILYKIPKIPENSIHKLIEKFGSVQKIFAASQKELVEVEGIGDVRATLLKEGILKLRNNIL
ncbi:DNA integrity scanning diadenylate cyclase DisA [Candidatus Calescamantes bacterium]|nr:DNA integrity scanning diadenylate cyclase DisA [Candidatus Calescamantes bacterium]MCK5398892.1 DNA integrity scanning diadenylate cyclase DisA [bacterium]MCK5598604.1 DNA integrity scanning diadenylate cyclase DisA [bacterium]